MMRDLFQAFQYLYSTQSAEYRITASHSHTCSESPNPRERRCLQLRHAVLAHLIISLKKRLSSVLGGYSYC